MKSVKCAFFDFDNTTQVARDYTYSVALSNDENFSVANYNDANWIEVGRTPKGARTCVTDFDLSEKVVARYVKLYDLRVLEATSFAVTEVQVFATKGDVANAKAYANNELDAYKADVPLTEEEANGRDISEIENLAKGGPIAFADYYILNNDGIEEYYNELDTVLNKIFN